MKRKKIGIAMSGGIDSTCCALMLKEHHDITGYFMHLKQPDISHQIEQVQNIADRLKVELKIIDLQDQFEEKVLRYFSDSYHHGVTPNPCIVCNREIKFGLFMDTILATGMDLVATGHYAQIVVKDNTYHLLQGKDHRKDQSYFLSRLTQNQLGRSLFPLGQKTKQEMYSFAEASGFTNFRGQESQDVCFLGQEKIGNFLQEHLSHSSEVGPILNVDGQLLGEHSGLFRYTIGQRRGLGISDTTPYYVVKLDPSNNTLIVGKDKDLFQTTITVHSLHWILDPPKQEEDYLVRIRYSHKGSSAKLVKLSNNKYSITFSSPQRSITPGQFAVIYKDSEVIGSGIII